MKFFVRITESSSKTNFYNRFSGKITILKCLFCIAPNRNILPTQVLHYYIYFSVGTRFL